MKIWETPLFSLLRDKIAEVWTLGARVTCPLFRTVENTKFYVGDRSPFSVTLSR
jgi:hypothetical protein